MLTRRFLASPLAIGLVAGLLAVAPIPAIEGTATAANATSPPFTECPAVGADTSCGVLVVVTDSGASVLSDPSQGPYDSVEDTLIGVVNNSSRTIGALALRSSTDLFGFDGDGICTYGVVACGPTGYEGPNTSFSDVSPDATSGVVNFPAGLAAGASTFFSLEESLSSANVQTGSGQAAVTVYEQGQAPNPREPNVNCSTAKPVNCATGEFWHTFTDISVPGRGIPISFTRTYNSLAAASGGPLGHGWTSSYTMALSTDSNGNVTVAEENGATITFAPAGGGSYTAPSRVLAALVGNSDGTYTLSDFGDGYSYTFSATGQLTDERDRNGYTTTLSYTGGLLSAVTDPAGRILTVTNDASGHITKLADPAGRTVTFGYDAAGNLTSATDVGGGTWSFGYDANHLLTSMKDPRGGVTTNVYDSQGRVVSQTDPMGRRTTFAYSGDPTTATGSTTTITDPKNDVVTQTYSELQLVALTRGTGTSAAATWDYSYDPFTLRLASITDPNGRTTSHTYDRHGNMLSVTDALGHTTTFSYNSLNQPVRMTDPSGVAATFGYDSAGNLTSVARPLTSTGQTQTTVYTYGDSQHPGDITSVTEPTGNVWSFGYDADGDLTSVTDPLADVTTYGFDGIGRRTSVTSARGKTTTYAYDAFRDLTKQTDPLGDVTTLRLDADRNLVSVTDPDGRTTGYTYDADNELTGVTRADGTTLTYGYDSAGNQTAQTDAAGATTGYGYDPLNRVVSVTDALGRTTALGYDPAGNRTSLTDAAGAVTSFGYDAANELTSIGYSNGTTPGVSLAYTANGLRASMTDGTGTTSYTYDSLNRLTSQTNGAGQVVRYGYDLGNNLTALTYPNGQQVTRGYDAAGRLTSITDWLGHTTTVSVDGDGQTAAVAYPNGVTATQTFDAADRLTASTDTAAGSTLASFSYTHDANGELTSTAPTGVSQPNETYSYTQLNQLASVNSAAYSYDAAGNVTRLASGATMTYNAAGEATAFTPAGGSSPATLSYDPSGNRLNGLAPDGTAVNYTYDQANRLTSIGGGGSGSAVGLVAGGEYHSLAVGDDGTIWAWGNNSYGQLGNGTTTSTPTPVHVTGLSDGVAVAAGAVSSAALTRSGTVFTWGDNTYGQLGDGTTVASSAPVQVPGLTGVSSVAAGNYHVLAVKTDGTVEAWGSNAAGQLGDGTTTSRTRPVAVQGLTGVVQVAAGGLPGWAGQSVALRNDGTVWTWGYGKSGQLGLGSTTSNPTPTQVPGLTGVVQIAAGGDDTYALKSDGTEWAWGDNSYGQLGTTAAKHTQSSPIQVRISGVTAIGAGGTHALAVKTDGSVWAWGNNNTGQLGDGGACGKICTTPVASSGLTGAVAVTGGYVHSLAVLGDGSLRAWGRNAEGELGDGTTTVRPTPVTVEGLPSVKPAGSVNATYTYDGSGLRSSRTSGSTTQHFAWDVEGSVPLLLTDGSTSYIYDDAGVPVEQISTAGTALYYQHDQYGSTRLLTDSSGSVAATFSYTPYGDLTSHTGTADTPLRWNGQYEDTESGLYYLRARYYDPTTAQFLSRDPLEALTRAPYGYASGDPLNGMDPSGLGCGWTSPWDCGGTVVQAVGGAVTTTATAVGGFVYDHAGEISAGSGALAVILAPIPGVDVVSPILGGISVATGALATGKDIGEGNYGQAVIDGFGTLVGGAGFVEDMAARVAMRAAQVAWDTGEPVVDLARLAEEFELSGSQLDRVAAVLAILGVATDRSGLFGEGASGCG